MTTLLGRLYSFIEGLNSIQLCELSEAPQRRGKQGVSPQISDLIFFQSTPNPQTDWHRNKRGHRA
jgi:hypothetical protein